MWERCHELVEAPGFLGRLRQPGHRRRARRRPRSPPSGADRRGDVTAPRRPRHLLDAVTVLLNAMDPPVPAEVRAAADDLGFRDFLSVALVVPAEKVAWTDNWIYIHEPDVKTMRVQNFGSWSPYMVKDGHNVLGLEYTVRRATSGGPPPTSTSSTGASASSRPRAHGRRRRRRRLRRADAEGLPRSTTTPTKATSRPCGSGSSNTPRTCTRSAATACTSTTTRTTRCTRRC